MKLDVFKTRTLSLLQQGMTYNELIQRVWKGGPDPAFPPLFRENPASRTFFISFPNLAFLSQKNTLKSLISTKAYKCKM